MKVLEILQHTLAEVDEKLSRKPKFVKIGEVTSLTRNSWTYFRVTETLSSDNWYNVVVTVNGYETIETFVPGNLLVTSAISNPVTLFYGRVTKDDTSNMYIVGSGRRFGYYCGPLLTNPTNTSIGIIIRRVVFES